MLFKNPTLEAAVDYAITKARTAKDVSTLPEPVQTVAIVVSAQGVLGNGGFQFFFEADFPGKPPYSIFVDAFRRIGVNDTASSLAEAIALFPFVRPHLSVRKRKKFMDKFKDEEGEPVNSPFERLEKQLCKSDGVRRKLETYIAKNLKALGG